MAGLPRPVNPDVVVGTETADDAGVYRLSGDTAIVFLMHLKSIDEALSQAGTSPSRGDRQ